MLHLYPLEKRSNYSGVLLKDTTTQTQWPETTLLHKAPFMQGKTILQNTGIKFMTCVAEVENSLYIFKIPVVHFLATFPYSILVFSHFAQASTPTVSVFIRFIH